MEDRRKGKNRVRGRKEGTEERRKKKKRGIGKKEETEEKRKRKKSGSGKNRKRLEKKKAEEKRKRKKGNSGQRNCLMDGLAGRRTDGCRTGGNMDETPRFFLVPSATLQGLSPIFLGPSQTLSAPPRPSQADYGVFQGPQRLSGPLSHSQPLPRPLKHHHGSF